MTKSAEEIAKRILNRVDQFVVWDLNSHSGWNISKDFIVEIIEQVRSEGIRAGMERAEKIMEPCMRECESCGLINKIRSERAKIK